jgi:hypothetical protein
VSWSVQEDLPEVRIDRLVLEIPGLDAAQARRLAFGIGERLAGAGLSGERAKIGITLGPSSAGQGDLAGRIVAALMERLV